MDTLKQRVITSMEWMIKDMKWKADQTIRQNQDANAFGTPNEYSPELTEAINLLEELKK